MLKLKNLLEDASPSKFDKTRMPQKLSQVDKDQAAAQVVGGTKDGDTGDDVIAVNNESPMITDLKPSQTSMNNPKAMSFVVRALNQEEPFNGTNVLGGNAGDLGAFTSDDDHILDGHHRWIAAGMVNPKAKMKVNKIAWPADPILNVLNALTKGKFNVQKGKPASGGFNQFAKGPIEKAIDDVIANGNSFGDSPEKVKAAFTKLIGKEGEMVDDATLAAETKAIITKNIGDLNFSLPAGAPSRPDMPVISAKMGHVKQAIDALEKGEVDVNPPFADAVADGYKSTKPLLESNWKRFQKIANIKK